MLEVICTADCMTEGLFFYFVLSQSFASQALATQSALASLLNILDEVIARGGAVG